VSGDLRGAASGDRSTIGRVILVGGGPGDPDLITLRGAAALREADAVVYDSLAPRELLELAPDRAERINVGKRGHDSPTRPQQEITELLVSLAREGKTVVRLKGGDPFVFGRGGEEVSACRDAGIPFAVVPGVSSVVGALAYAGVPVTDRRYGASFAVVTGHKDPTQVTEDTRWEALGSAVDTVVILMGMKNLESIVVRILAGGRDPATPAAVVTHGTLPEQVVVEAPLGELVARVREAGVSAPGVVVIGDVVRLRDALSWYERRPLFVKRVLVTRAREQADELVSALRAAGAQAVLEPMIRLLPPVDPSQALKALPRLGSYDALVLTSANAVRFTARRAAAANLRLTDAEVTVACVGPRTAEAARAQGFAVVVVPESRYDGEGLLAAIEKQLPPAGRRFLLPHAAGARDVLRRGLEAAGAPVDAVEIYRSAPPQTDGAGLRAQLCTGRLHALTFTSPSTVRNFVALLDPASREAVARCRIACIGPVTAEALRREGFEPDVVPERAGAADLVAALAAAAPERSP
jgi:uroporphyrinogen III methyltransferase/synthase